MFSGNFSKVQKPCGCRMGLTHLWQLCSVDTDVISMLPGIWDQYIKQPRAQGEFLLISKSLVTGQQQGGRLIRGNHSARTMGRDG